MDRLPFVNRAEAVPYVAAPLQTRSQVSLATGTDHVDLVFQALQPFKAQVAAAIGNRPVLIKPNCVSATGSNVLNSDTPVECLEAILEFLSSIGKTDVTVAENSPGALTMTAFSNNNYFSLLKKYPVRFKELSQEGALPMTTWNSGSSYRSASSPTDGVFIAKMLVKPRKYFVISACKPKTHNYQVATLSYKNIVMGSALENQTMYVSGQSGWPDVKQHMHWVAGNAGSNNTQLNIGCQDLCDTIFSLIPLLAPDMAVIDEFQGMQGNGRTGGTMVNQYAAIAGLDWLAVDRVAVEMMNIKQAISSVGGDATAYTSSSKSAQWPWPMYPAALNYCGQAGMGQYALSLIDVLGPAIASVQHQYTLHSNITSGTSPQLVTGYAHR